MFLEKASETGTGFVPRKNTMENIAFIPFFIPFPINNSPSTKIDAPLSETENDESEPLSFEIKNLESKSLSEAIHAIAQWDESTWLIRIDSLHIYSEDEDLGEAINKAKTQIEELSEELNQDDSLLEPWIGIKSFLNRVIS